MVARARALGNYDPSLYFRGPQSAGGERGRDAGGRSIAAGYGLAGQAASVDGGDWLGGVARAAPVGGKFRYSRPARDHKRNR